MIVLDTNVVSEAMKPEPDSAVRAWLNDQAAEYEENARFHICNNTTLYW